MQKDRTEEWHHFNRPLSNDMKEKSHDASSGAGVDIKKHWTSLAYQMVKA